MERIKNAIEKILTRIPLVRGKGEEATKQALVLPLLDSLGYDIWNPSEVCPEYEADFATKKYGQKEKVDLAIFIENVPRIYMEVKTVDAVLDGHEGQLARYFNATTSVSLAILTNGIEYRFYTDTAEANVMDSVPFHVSRFDSVDQGLEVLARFQKAVFSAEAIREYARELNYTAKIVGFLREQLDLRDRDPSETLVRWILACEDIYNRRITGLVVENFSPIVKNALQIVLRDVVRRSLAAMENEVSSAPKSADTPSSESDEAKVPEPANAESAIQNELQTKIVTTDAELQAFSIVKEQFEHSYLAHGTIYDATVKKEVPIQLAYKDTTGYFAIYFNKPTWWMMRLVLDAKTKWVGFNLPLDVGSQLVPPGLTKLEPSPWAEFRIAITSVEDLHQLSRVILASFKKAVEERAAKQDSAAADQVTDL
ncbi:MAG: type I restriction enzyme HsdR N-terminal domain-containing protein [Acidobacteria bacterium]|nr:type I restriction enzyme HsdR N-terminal domain-containing protein [Acidobacteriota bacterium]